VSSGQWAGQWGSSARRFSIYDLPFFIREFNLEVQYRWFWNVDGGACLIHTWLQRLCGNAVCGCAARCAEGLCQAEPFRLELMESGAMPQLRGVAPE
jgi:hypothetical protein